MSTDNSVLDLPATTDTAQPDPTQKGGTAYDPDGRRRIVLTRAEQRTIDRAIRILHAVGLGVVVGCKGRDDGKPPCGLPLLMEGVDAKTQPGAPNRSSDLGYGCNCSRVHFEGAGAHGR